MTEDILLFLFLAATAIQLLYWLLAFSRLAFYRQPPLPPGPPEPVSVIICARNEEKNLRRNLPYFLAQDYPEYEVIVVNDNSFDKTFDVLLDFQKKSPILRLIDVKVDTRGKKAALSKGIKAAKFEILLLSDADCRPASPQWLNFMQAFIRDRAQIGLGYSPYFRGKGILNAFIRFETTYSAIQYLSFALMGLPYMGVGRNLCYRKSLFRGSGGFDSHAHIASGDDDLFINQVATRDNTRVILSPQAFVFSEPKSSWRGYYRQKSRHLTTGTRYRLVHQLALGLLSASHFGHYACGFALILYHSLELTVLLNYLARIGVASALYILIMRKLHDTSLIRWVPALDVLYAFSYLVFAPALFLKSKEKWK
ncbi:MAG: glycosyltransferase [Lewinellaceae bacterium]|nr:glycosyltransferase [Lewinellaceae bacterium]